MILKVIIWRYAKWLFISVANIIELVEINQ